MAQLSLWGSPSPARGRQGAASAADPGAVPPLEVDPVGWLEARLGRSVRLVFTNNRSSMVSFREQVHRYSIRLHRAFLGAPVEVWEDLVAYLRGDRRGAGQLLDAFIARIDVARPRGAVRLQPVGRYHDLQEIFDEVNARYFHGASQARITWGQGGGRRRRRSIQLGSYVGDDRLIRIHPCLDQGFVPRYYVAWVVFHEMLHEVFGVGDHTARGTRRSLHPPEFVALEESHPDFERSQRWERENLDRLLRYKAR